MGFRLPQLSRRNRERVRRWRQSTINFVLYPWFAITGACSWVGRTIARAWGARHLRYMLQGLPAVFAVSGVLVLAVGVAAQNKPNLAADYYLETAKALIAKDYSLARTHIEKAIALDGAK